MSREFGTEYGSGYFHNKIAHAAEDCERGRDELTRLWGAFLHELCPVAHAISSSEACDSGPEYPIAETIARMPILKDRLEAIADYVSVFDDYAREAIEKAVNARAAAKPVSARRVKA